jgi:alkylation response protein AidB-like acyl-CoA dehydrogenase
MEWNVDFELTDEQQMLRTLVERFTTSRRKPASHASLRPAPAGHFSENWALLADMGLLAVPFDAAHGGLGGGAVDIITAMEAFGRGLTAEPVLHEIVAGRLLQAAGTQEQVASWLPRVIDGTTHLVLAQAEHASRFDLQRCGTRFVQGRLHGAKTWVPACADVYIVTAQGESALQLVLVTADAAGLSRRDYRLVDGSFASEISFDAVEGEAMAGGLAALEDAAQIGRLAASAEMIGLANLLFDATLDYVRQRRQFGVPIGSFQAIQHRLADAYASLELARSHLYRCALAEPSVREAAVAAAKSYISTVAVGIGEEAIQLHGGIGVSDELIIGHAHKRVLLLAQYLGDADYELGRYNRARREASEKAEEGLLF